MCLYACPGESSRAAATWSYSCVNVPRVSYDRARSSRRCFFRRENEFDAERQSCFAGIPQTSRGADFARRPRSASEQRFSAPCSDGARPQCTGKGRAPKQ